MQVLSYFERPSEEQPEANIWHHPKRLEEWWEAVEQNRRDEAAGRVRVPEAEEPEHGMSERNPDVAAALAALGEE